MDCELKHTENLCRSPSPTKMSQQAVAAASTSGAEKTS